MTTEQAKAQLKSAAWALVSLIGTNEAIKVLEWVVSEIRHDQWKN